MTLGGLLGIIFVGFVAGMIARWVSPGANDPKGFILTVVLGIAGAFVMTALGQALGYYSHGQGASYVAATIGAIIILFIWNRLAVSGKIPDAANRP